MRRPTGYRAGGYRASVIAVAVALAAGTVTGAVAAPPDGVRGLGQQGAGAGKAGEAGQMSGSRKATVTLITGDRVDVDAKGRVTSVRPGAGREHIPVSVRSLGDRTYVIPADAVRLVGNGTVDRRLFDVTRLIEDGLDDAAREKLPLIVAHPKGAARAKLKAAAKSDVVEAGATVERNLPALNGEAVSVPKDDASEVWDALTAETTQPDTAQFRAAAPGISRVWLDGRRQVNLDRSTAQIGAPAAWEAGYDGDGVKVAVIDTGVDETHPDLAGAEIEEKDFSDEGDVVDYIGHGTHVASTIAGSGARASGAKASGVYKGVAPGAKILDAKVFDSDGYASDSGILAAMQWAADRGAKVANMSLGSYDTPETDPLEEAVESLSASSGILFVVSAGNDGPGARTIGSPGSAPAALTVGAVDRDDSIAGFSSTGPTAVNALKPDITAPGVDIVAARAAHAAIGTPASDGYLSMSGTSMAAPHVAGAAAIVAQRHPDWSGERIKQALTSSAVGNPGLRAYQQGNGRADVAKALAQTVVTEQTSVDFGLQRWSPAGSDPVTKSITYRNDGTEAVTLDLRPEALGPDGKPAPDGMFTVGAERITVQPGATARVALTANTRAADGYGDFSGAVVATATSGATATEGAEATSGATATEGAEATSGAKAATSGQSVRTAFGVIREEESYDVTMDLIDENGAPAQAMPTFISLGTPGHYQQWTETGRIEVRVPKGEYLVDAPVFTPGNSGGMRAAQLVQQRLAVTGDTRVVFDARDAKPFAITAPKATEEGGGTVAWYRERESGGGEFGRIMTDSLAGLSAASVGDSVNKEFQAQVSATRRAGTDQYTLLYTRDGRMFDGLTHQAKRSELAVITADMGVSAKNKVGAVHPMWSNHVMGIGSLTVALFPLPVSSKQYVTTPPGYRWSFGAGQVPADEEYIGSNEVLFDPAAQRTYKAGKSYGITLNVGVFSPTMREGVAARVADLALICAPVYSDHEGRPGYTRGAENSTVMTADDKTVYEGDNPECAFATGLPAASAAYTLRTESSRGTDIAGVSTRVQAAWTFRSASPGDKQVDLPLSTLTFAPKLNLASEAAAGAKLTVPLAVDGYAAGVGVASLEVEASYDGGKTWVKAPVTTKDGERTVTLKHPASATSVSLKGALTDTEGNGYEVTITDAYLLK
ncbi:S8 family serine peptidase [Streptomyces paludis]|uniref:1,4-dihydropyridine esterase n=1 Tax=Streptomyces paludis TaxID=2282738 RepID=A0A345HL63_9ACTN|nr:S8 family serine peptidase [Streptomyces paludis]AXG77437.1 1,4-dihydropyridine esterase [Streptomyces paludis]